MALTLTAGTPAQSTSSVTTQTVNLDPATVDGDWTIVLTTLNSSSTGNVLTGPTGWDTVLASTDTVNGSTSAHIGIWAKKYVAGDPTTATVTCPNASGRIATLPVRVQGADATTLLDVVPVVTQANANTTAPVAPSITPATTGAALVSVFMARSGSTGVFIDFTTPTGMSLVGSAHGNMTSSTNSCETVFAQTGLTAGTATGTRSSTASSTTSGALALSFAIKPSTATAPAFSGSATLAGSGQLTATGTAAIGGTASLAGSGALTTTGSPATTGTVTLAGAGALTATGKPAATGAVTLSGPGTLTATGTPALKGSAALAGTGALTLSGVATFAPAYTGTTVLTGTGSFAATGVPALRGTLTLAGVGVLTATGSAIAPDVDHTYVTLALTSTGISAFTLAGDGTSTVTVAASVSTFAVADSTARVAIQTTT